MYFARSQANGKGHAIMNPWKSDESRMIKGGDASFCHDHVEIGDADLCAVLNMGFVEKDIRVAAKALSKILQRVLQ